MGQLSRNRALEDLARKTYPKEAKKVRKVDPSSSGARGRGTRMGTVYGARRANQIQHQGEV